MPLFAEFVATANVRHSVDAAAVQPYRFFWGERGQLRPIKSSITVEQNGALSFLARFFLCARNMGTRVPSLDGYQTCSTSISASCDGTRGADSATRFPDASEYEKNVVGTWKEEYEKHTTGELHWPSITVTDPSPGSVISPTLLPRRIKNP